MESVTLAYEENPVDVVAVDQALTRLAEFDGARAKFSRCSYFGGMTLEETAEASGVSPATVQRELKVAKAWLHVHLKRLADG